MMETKKLKYFSAVFAVAVLFITAFILINSIPDYEKSHGSSGAILDTVLPEGTKDVVIDDKSVEFYIRKAAHFVEFAFLGCAVAGLAIAFADYRKLKFNFLGFELFYVLAIAVFDEHIQSLSDRSSSTRDILLDFAGALTGIAVIHMISYLIKRKSSKNHKAVEQ